MKKLLRLLFRLLLLVLIVITGIVIFNTLNYPSRQLPVEAVKKPGILPDAIDHLVSAVQIPTVSYEDRIDTNAFFQFNHFLDSVYHLADSMLEHRRINQFSHIYRWAGRRPALAPVLLIGHIDVVPVEGKSLEGWTVQPYSGLIQEGHIWGRGTIDDKLNVIGTLEAVTMLLKENYQPERTLYLAFGHDEEVGGNGAKAMAKWFARQGINFEYVLDEGMVIVKDAMPGLDKPAALIGTSEKGYTTLTLKVKLEEGGHSSMPMGESAIGILSRAVAKLEANPFPGEIKGPVADLFDHLGPEMTGINKAVFANLWLFEDLVINQLASSPGSNALMRTTIAPTILEAGVKDNVLPTTAIAKINFRIVPGETTKSVADYVRQTIDDSRVQVVEQAAGISSDPSKISATNSFGYNVIRKTTQEIFPDVVIAPALVIAATDSRHYKDVADQTYRFQPLQLLQRDLKRIHGIDERISIANYTDAICFYRQLVVNSCK